MIGAARVGGLVVLTSWLREGALNAAAEVLFEALPGPAGPRSRWRGPT